MTTKQILSALQDRKGQGLRVRILSDVPTLAAHRSNIVQKFSELTVISGISFDNRKDVKDAIEAGERGEVGPLPWGTWTLFPFVITHKGNDYIRLYLPSEAQRDSGFFGKPNVQFIANGQPITREQAVTLCGSKAQARENESGCMTVKAENLAIIPAA